MDARAILWRRQWNNMVSVRILLTWKGSSKSRLHFVQIIQIQDIQTSKLLVRRRTVTVCHPKPPIASPCPISHKENKTRYRSALRRLSWPTHLPECRALEICIRGLCTRSGLCTPFQSRLWSLLSATTMDSQRWTSKPCNWVTNNSCSRCIRPHCDTSKQSRTANSESDVVSSRSVVTVGCHWAGDTIGIEGKRRKS